LLASLTQAIAKDGKNAANLDACKRIAAVARILADKSKTDSALKTAGDVYTLWSQSVKNVVQPNDVLQVRLAVGAYLNAKLPTALDAALDTTVRQQLAAEFTNVALAMEALS
jgi:hypothetical protein